MVRRRPAESGIAVLAALLVLLLVSLASALVMASLELRMRVVQQEARRVHLSALSDAAIAETVAELSRNRGYPGIPRRSFDDGWLESSVVDLGTGRRQVTARAGYGGWTETVQVEARFTPTSARILGWRRLAEESTPPVGSPRSPPLVPRHPP
jgi:hypothetical protein